ncbi:MAG TPA: hypothetical protein VFN88_13955, partial [Caulobacteraceae bacterium]|nr:hypothetical protein [Caulobacteraceae bacterium]
MRSIKRGAAVCAAAAAFGGAAIAGLMQASAASAQVDPFAAAIPRPQPKPTPGETPPATAAPGYSTRVGFTGVEQAVGAGYAGARTTGVASMAQIRMLPRQVAPIPIVCKVSAPRVLAARPKIAIPTYAVAVVRQGGVRASAAGAGAELAQRATSLSTVLIGVDDALAARIADEAYADLVRQMTAAGLEVIAADRLQGDQDMARLKVVGPQVRGVNDWSIYSPAAAPLREGHPFDKAVLAGSKSNIVLNDVS